MTDTLDTFNQWLENYFSDWRPGPLEDIADCATKATGIDRRSAITQLVSAVGIDTKVPRLLQATRTGASGSPVVHYKYLMAATKADLLEAAAYNRARTEGR